MLNIKRFDLVTNTMTCSITGTVPLVRDTPCIYNPTRKGAQVTQRTLNGLHSEALETQATWWPEYEYKIEYEYDFQISNQSRLGTLSLFPVAY